MLCKIIFDDKSWVIGRRINLWERLKMGETKGTHHYIIKDASEFEGDLIGKRVAIPISKMKYHIFLKY